MRVRVVSGQRRVLLSVPEGTTVGGFSERVASMCELDEVPALFLDGFRLLENEDAAQVLRDNDTVLAGGAAMSGAMSVAMNTHVSAAKRQCLPPPPFFSSARSYCPSFSEVRSYVSLSRYRAPSEAPSRCSYCPPRQRDVRRAAMDAGDNSIVGEDAGTRAASAPSKSAVEQVFDQENARSRNAKQSDAARKRDGVGAKVTVKTGLDGNSAKTAVDGVSPKTAVDGVSPKTGLDGVSARIKADVANNDTAPSSWELPRGMQWPATDSVWVAMEGGVSTSRPWEGEFVRYRIVEFAGTPPTPTTSKPKVGYVDKVLNDPLRLVLVSKRKTFDVIEAASILQPHVLMHSRKPKSRKQQVSSAPATETRAKAVGEQQEQQDLQLRLRELKQRLLQQKTQERREQDKERQKVPDHQQELRHQEEQQQKLQHRQKQMQKLQGMLEQVLEMDDLAEQEQECEEQQRMEQTGQGQSSAQEQERDRQKLLEKQQEWENRQQEEKKCEEQKIVQEQERERQKLLEQQQEWEKRQQEEKKCEEHKIAQEQERERQKLMEQQQEREKQQHEEQQCQEQKQMEKQQYLCDVQKRKLLETHTASSCIGASGNSSASAPRPSKNGTQSSPVEHHAAAGQVDRRSAATFQRMEDGVIRHPLLGDLEVPAGEDAEKFVSMKLRRLRQAVKRQIEYYFSDTNLAKDTFLQSAQDACGFVSISLICSFNRVKAMCVDRNFIVESLKDSEVVEISGKSIRRRSASWPVAVKKWSEQREEALASS